MIDLRTVRRDVDVESRVAELKEILSPHLTNEPTLYRAPDGLSGKYIRAGKGRQIAYHAAMAIAHYNGMQSARDSGDIDGVISHSIGFSAASHEVENIQTWGKSSTDALAQACRESNVQRSRRAGTGYLTDDEWGIVEEFIEKQIKDNRNKKQACNMAESQLRTGQLQGISRHVDFEPGSLRSQLYKREHRRTNPG